MIFLDKEKRVFIEPQDPRLVDVLNSRPPTIEQVEAGLERDMKHLVDAFAKQLSREEGLRDDIIVGPPCPTSLD